MMRKKRSNILTIVVIIYISCSSCSDSINEDKIYCRIDELIGDWGRIDVFSSKFDFIEENYADNIFTNDKELLELLGNAYKMVGTRETAIKIAEAIFMESLGDSINDYKPFYTVLYKNVWVVYGCYDIRNAIESNWKNIGEWDEAIIVISKHTGEILGKFAVLRR